MSDVVSANEFQRFCEMSISWPIALTCIIPQATADRASKQSEGGDKVFAF